METMKFTCHLTASSCVLSLIAAAFSLLLGCSPQLTSSGVESRPPVEAVQGIGDFPQRLSSQHLPNAVRVHDKVICGGLPADEPAFQELAALSVRTIISVDGAQPDVELAAKYGARYVHLPHGYDGISQQRVRELAKAVRDLDGPIYIHCHHGKHRSPAAASVACVSAGLVPSSQAVKILEVAGTSHAYRGLYRSAEHAHALEAALLDTLQADFPAIAELPPLAVAMVKLEQTQEHLNLLAAEDWRTPREHPDIEPSHEALLLREQFTELLRTDEVRRQPAAFQELLRDSESAALELEAALTQWKSAAQDSVLPATISKLARRIAENCTNCHVRYRDVPLDEKAPHHL